MLVSLGVLFACIGIVSTVIGLGGGTFYLLVLQIFNISYLVIPIISLMCNVSVSGLGTLIRCIKGERTSVKFLLVILLPSMIMSYIGASIRLEEGRFRFFLNIMLLVIIIARVLLQMKVEQQHTQRGENSVFVIETQSAMFFIKFIIISAAIGLISGMIGIGGGIVLGPILYIYGLSYKNIPLITAIYILLNSIVGLLAQVHKVDNMHILQPYLVLPVVCMASSIVCMRYVNYRIKSKQVRNIAISTVIFVAVYNLIKGGIQYVI